MAVLRDYLPAQTFAVVTSYQNDKIQARVAACFISQDNSLVLTFPKDNPFSPGESLTIHLDNRTGAEAYDGQLRVYRTSYRGIARGLGPRGLQVEPLHFQLFFGVTVVAEYRSPDYTHPQDRRSDQPLPPVSSLGVDPDVSEAENKLGIWITRASGWPHTTVMAFLSSKNDDIFLISHRGTFKSSLVHRDGRCCFALDHRANFLFERAVDWNFTILEAQAHLVPTGSSLFAQVQGLFVQKNPWEQVFFTDPQVEMFYLKPQRILCAGQGRP